MENYYKRIDTIINLLVEEYSKKHETLTKVINYEYYCGQLWEVYELIKINLGYNEMLKAFNYRQKEIITIHKKFNVEIVNPLYERLRGADI